MRATEVADAVGQGDVGLVLGVGLVGVALVEFVLVGVGECPRVRRTRVDGFDATRLVERPEVAADRAVADAQFVGDLVGFERVLRRLEEGRHRLEDVFGRNLLILIDDVAGPLRRVVRVRLREVGSGCLYPNPCGL